MKCKSSNFIRHQDDRISQAEGMLVSRQYRTGPARGWLCITTSQKQVPLPGVPTARLVFTIDIGTAKLTVPVVCCIYTENSYSTLLDRRREGQMFQCQCLDNSQRFQGGAHLHYTVKSLPNNCSTDALASLLSLLVLTSRPCSDSMYINIEFPVV